MTKKPIINAGLALMYIVLVVTIMSVVSEPNTPDLEFVTPIAALSLFTLSAAVMGYLFVAEPLKMYIDGKKNEGMQLFLQTVGVFAVITVLVFLIMLLGGGS